MNGNDAIIQQEVAQFVCDLLNWDGRKDDPTFAHDLEQVNKAVTNLVEQHVKRTSIFADEAQQSEFRWAYQLHLMDASEAGEEVEVIADLQMQGMTDYEILEVIREVCSVETMDTNKLVDCWLGYEGAKRQFDYSHLDVEREEGE